MNKIQAHHQMAMEFADKAFMARLHNKTIEINSFFTKAFENERKAAMIAIEENTPEPSRSILLRSAASLAIDCHKYNEAEKLICLGLAGSPPVEIAEELRDLFEQVNFGRHLQLRGITLAPEEMQVSITGDAVSFGVISAEKYLQKVDSIGKLVFRTAERKSGEPFREKGRMKKDIQENFETFISVPRAASFAATFRFGRPGTQTKISIPDSGICNPFDVVDEMMECIELFNNSQEEALKKRILDQAYYNNFVGLVGEIAPDGKEIRQVGFTCIRNGKSKAVALVRAREMTDAHILELSTKTFEKKTTKVEKIKIIGELRYADSTKPRQDRIKLIDETGKTHIIIIPEGMMHDIVKPLWGETVVVEGRKEKNHIFLERIQKLD